MQSYVPEICGVECGSRRKVVQNLVLFCAANLGRAFPKNFWAFLNRHHFRLNGQVWLRSHGWSFIYADEIKKEK